MVEEVAVGALLPGVAAGDHVEQEPPPADLLEGLRLLGEQGGEGEAGPEGHQQLEPLGPCRHGAARHQGIGTARPDRGQHRLETGRLGGAGHLGQVVERRGPGRGASRRDGGRGGPDVMAVAGGRQEPVQAHLRLMGLKRNGVVPLIVTT
ncbi:hypothetical protein GCM10018952_22290 [Streptosporangium vulgare]